MESGTKSSNVIENTAMPVTTPIVTPSKVFAFTDPAISVDPCIVVVSAPAGVSKSGID